MLGGLSLLSLLLLLLMMLLILLLLLSSLFLFLLSGPCVGFRPQRAVELFV